MRRKNLEVYRFGNPCRPTSASAIVVEQLARISILNDLPPEAEYLAS